MRIKHLPEQQADLLLLIAGAMRDGKVVDGDETLPILTATAQHREFTRNELARLTAVVQRHVALDVYSTRQAAAWLGYSVNGVAAAIKDGRIRASKPGHDLLITHAELVRFNEQERRYRLSDGVLPVSKRYDEPIGVEALGKEQPYSQLDEWDDSWKWTDGL